MDEQNTVGEIEQKCRWNRSFIAPRWLTDTQTHRHTDTWMVNNVHLTFWGSYYAYLYDLIMKQTALHITDKAGNQGT